ncbi:Ig-like domain-containing protein, partial [Singulisphaera rosea]
DFGFSDPNDSPANNFASIVVTNVVGATGLTYNGAAPTNGQVIPVADIAAGKLIYTPPANANGSLYAKFSFQVKDDGGAANGGVDTDPVARSMYVTITSVNDAPVGIAKAVTILEDTTYTFTIADFGFSDPNDNPANAFGYIVVSNIPTTPGLTLAGAPLTNGQVITTYDLADGKLKFQPPANAAGGSYIKFSFQVRDNGGTANGGVNTDPIPRSMYVTVTPVNDAPVGTSKTVTTLEDSSYTFGVNDFGFSDPLDNPANAFGYIVVSNLPTSPGLTLNGAPLTNGQVITTIDLAAGKLKYTPTANANGAAYFKFSFQVRDNGGTANGGVNTDPSPKTITVNVTPVNDAPVGTSKTVTMLEESTYTFGVNDFGFSDPNDSPANAFGYIVVSNLPANPGLTFDGAPLTNGQVITTYDLAAGKLKFKPTANANGLAYIQFNFQVRDNGGTANGGVNTDPTPKTITVNVTPVNDAPLGIAKAVTTLEDKPYVFTVADFGFSDPNDSPANNFASIVVTNVVGATGLTYNGAAPTNGQVI